MGVPFFDIPDRMRKAREYADLEQAEMAERLGVTRTTVSRWETGASKVKTLVLRAWAQETDVPLAWLQWGMTEAPTTSPSGAAIGADNAVVRPKGFEPPTF